MFQHPYLLRCRWGHIWQIMKSDSLRFTDRSERFCRACLEEERICVAAICLHTSGLNYGNSLLAWCYSCQRDTRLPLLPDLPSASMAEEGMDDLWVERDRWFWLPTRWPPCAYCGAPLADGAERHPPWTPPP